MLNDLKTAKKGGGSGVLTTVTTGEIGQVFFLFLDLTTVLKLCFSRWLAC